MFPITTRPFVFQFGFLSMFCGVPRCVDSLKASTGGNAFRADANWYIAFFGDNRIGTTVFTETDRSKSSLGGDGVVNGLSLLTFQMLNSPTLRLKR